jgi:hypothetical protein
MRMKVREEIGKRVLLRATTFSHDYYPEMELWPLLPTQDYYRSYIMEARYMDDHDCLRLQINE